MLKFVHSRRACEFLELLQTLRGRGYQQQPKETLIALLAQVSSSRFKALIQGVVDIHLFATCLGDI